MTIQKWIRISLFSLLIVALIGVILRYKILYPLPFIHQKHLMHGHSHFAFAGWVTQILMAFIIDVVGTEKNKPLFKKYHWLLVANIITAYGMLISFILQGYGLYSIIFSNCSIIISYVFSIIIWREINSIVNKHNYLKWFKAALVWQVIASIGAFALAYMMVTKNLHQNWYLAAVYFFLHFQYNGWFLFACLGLLFHQLYKANIKLPIFNTVFWLFALACLPAYFLSTLWLKIPLLFYILIVVAAIAQVIGLILLWQKRVIIKNIFSKAKHKTAYIILGLSALAFCIKLLLQLGSTIPSLSDLAFGFRPIVIGYLHLVLLGVITLFILGYCLFTQPNMFSKINIKGVAFFSLAVVINEVLLMLQGVTFMGYIIVPFVNEALLFTAFLLLFSLILINISNKKVEHDLNHTT